MYETVTEQVLVKEASTKVITRQPKYTTTTETIEISPATTKWTKSKADKNCLSADPNDCLVWCLVEVPAQYQTVTKQEYVGCVDASGNTGSCQETVEVPAQYSTITKKVLKNSASVTEVAGGEGIYKTYTKKVLKSAATTRAIEVPAKYQTITRQKLVASASTSVVDVPAEYATIKKSVIANPATSTSVEIPAEYKTITYQKVATPATVSTTEVAAEYKTVSYRKLVSKGGFTEWRETVCPALVVTGSTYTSIPSKGVSIFELQKTLAAKGYNPGPIDGVMGSQTKAALVEYQKANSLPIGQLDYETLKSLGLK